MKKKAVQQPVAFSPEKIQFLSFHLLRAAMEGPFDFNLVAVRSYRIDWNHSTEINDDDPFLLKSNLSIKISSDSGGVNPTEATGAFDFSFLFRIENLPELLEKSEDGSISLGGPLPNAIASISYSTARGILLIRLQGTALRNFILPVIDPNQLLKLDEKRLK